MKTFFYAALSLILAIAIVVIGTFAFLYVKLSGETKERIQRGAIDSIIFSESPVFYDDGETVIGVFFDKIHRRYIQYPQIPSQFIKAIVAAEDKNFFTHPGFDIRAMVRATIANVRQKRVTQGGSTITQQTAKNVFEREQRSYKAKVKELIQALLLEREYSKEEILEMYVNQFFVAGIGRGLRIAGRYFFDKDAEHLDLVECAFIAGSVKSPNRYNPFTKKTETEKETAISLANRRKNYVLDNMLSLKFITREDYEKAKVTEISFKQGKLGYRLNVVLDYIREQLESEYFKQILMDQGIENIATSGIKIYTSINNEIQEGALRSLRRHLPLLNVKLAGYGSEEHKERYVGAAEAWATGRSLNDLPFLCRITEIHGDRENPFLVVSWEDGGGVIDFEGLKPLGDAWLKGRLGNWAVFEKRHVTDFFKNLRVGDLVPVQSLQQAADRRLFLSEIPELEGGIVVVHKGMIKAMVGGFFDRFFNRAADAKRQLGSIFKTMVYAAALQLKWNTLDPLMNTSDLYTYQNTFYVPRPNHQPESEEVSMAWAGVKSENLATVWLLYHLTDHLNMSEFRQIMELLDLDRKHDEPYEAYAARIRDRYGVLVDKDALMEAAFEQAKVEIETDMIFSGHEEAIQTVRRLRFHIDPAQLDTQKPEEFQILRLSFTRLQNLHEDLKKKAAIIKEMIAALLNTGDPGTEALLRGVLSSFYLDLQESGEWQIVFTNQPWPGLEPLLPEYHLEIIERLEFGDVRLDGIIPAKFMDLLQAGTVKQFERLASMKRYDAEVLFKVGDFRRLVNTLYVVRLSEELGISTKLDPVLSFPLGANAVSILEMALAYETMLTGNAHPLTDGMTGSMVPIITRIVDREGKILWEYHPRPKKILSERVSSQVANILRLVMEKGTGSTARDKVRLSLHLDETALEVPLPSFGKTGTANRFTNSSFVGFIPGPDEQSGRLGLDKGYMIASYVGFDDNRPMKNNQISIYGSSGALPLWIETANAIANSPLFKVNLDIAELAFESKPFEDAGTQGLRYVPVSPRSGLALPERTGSTPGDFPAVLSDADFQGHTLILKRIFEPLRGKDDR
jgi:penicillin-binding protein 1A